MKAILLSLRIVACCATLFWLAGCERSVPRTDYMPLRDGNRWEYRLLDMPLLKRIEAGQTIATAPLDADLHGALDSDLSTAAQFADPSAPAGTSGGEGADRPVASARRVALQLRESINPITYKALYDTAEQVWSKRNGYIGFQSGRGRNYLAILPPHTGYKWVVTGPAGQDLFYEIESANATVETPAGTFDHCVISRQESHNRQEIFKFWFAPDVGLVRRSKYFVNEEVFRQELVSYSVQPATPATRMEEDREVRHAVEGKNRGSEFRDKPSEDRPNRRDLVPRGDPDLDDKVQQFSDPK
jgi:hypothetical protein